MTEKELRNFTAEIKQLYEKGKIHAPIHLNGGNERQLIKVFKKYKKGDWIFSTWRSHWHWLLSGRSRKRLRKQILEGHSMHIFDKEFFTSSIVGGISPIALGVAYALRLKKSKKKVFCFLGDMAWTGGLSQECIRFASGHNLPVKYIIEDNNLSVTTPTYEVWGRKGKNVVEHYYYERWYPHAGTGTFVTF